MTRSRKLTFFTFSPQLDQASETGYLIVWFIEPIEHLRQRYCPFRLMRVERARANVQTFGKLRFRKCLSFLLVPKGFG